MKVTEMVLRNGICGLIKTQLSDHLVVLMKKLKMFKRLMTFKLSVSIIGLNNKNKTIKHPNSHPMTSLG